MIGFVSENVVLLERLLSDKEGSNCSTAKRTSKNCDKLMPASLTESSHIHRKYLLVSRLQTVFLSVKLYQQINIKDLRIGKPSADI